MAGLDLLLIAMHIDGSIRINPSSAVIDATTILFAIAADEAAFDPVCKHKRSSVSVWIDQFQRNRMEGNHAARQRAKHVKLQSPGALAKVFAASANPNFSQQDRLQSSSLLNERLYEKEEVSFLEKRNGSIYEVDEAADGESVNSFSEQSGVNKIPPMLGRGGFHSSPSQRKQVRTAMTAQERRASFASRDVRQLMKSTKKELIEQCKRDALPDSNLERLMNVVEQGGHTVLLMMMDDDLEDLEVNDT